MSVSKIVGKIHGSFVYSRRIGVLCHHLAEVLPRNIKLLDIGCGDGLLSHAIMEKRPDITITGVDILRRPYSHIPVEIYDGVSLPFAENSFDAALLVDMLHHTDDPKVLLREAGRIARDEVIIKDHTKNGFLAEETLKFMDIVGNARHGVRLPYNYWTLRQWEDAFTELALPSLYWRNSLNLYAPPFNLLFDRSLHFIARLDSKDKLSPKSKLIP